ncbi:MAG: preprotein translocase subunit SecG [Candidatus Omnitrophica bacterium]|nr:preprotein translocase subunit SecG [Candidatus Omnitrophota bacterium]MDD5081063.1 preprotein translocase subunit SecG [Candidatus Omnitrophota bacterium]
MYSFVWILHVLVVIGLVAVILVQRGRSGGLVEALGGIESVFGTKTNNFFVKMTVFLAILFFMTSVTLAYLSKQRGRSLIKNIPQAETGQTASQEIPDSK